MSHAVEFKGVWKKFRKGEKFNSVRDAFPNFIKNLRGELKPKSLDDREFWAVKDVSFSIPQGGVVGIMGPNGAGKSTILKLLSGIMSPTQGSMTIQGRLSALIEVTAGFHPELTGRENVYLNGTILGMKCREIDKKFDEIVEFSGVGDFIDTPVKRYSSGMYSRLGFSVAAHMDPEVLIVDEVLSVGDVSFQAKCAQKMRSLLSSGATILLVSHQIPLIQSLCKRVVLLDHGQLVKDGPTDEVIPFYQQLTYRRNEEDFRKTLQATDKVRVSQDQLVDIQRVTVSKYQNKPSDDLISGESVYVSIDYTAKQRIENPIIIIDILRSDGVVCCSINSLDYRIALPFIHHQGQILLHLPHFNLAPGVYLVKVSFWDREMIHPYIMYSNNVIRVNTATIKESSTAVFLPEVSWNIKQGS